MGYTGHDGVFDDACLSVIKSRTVGEICRWRP
jgi:hypothetical protein